MADFSAQISVSQSSECSTITVTDISNYTDNTQGFEREDFTTRKVEVRDSIGLLLHSLVVPNSGPSQDVVTFTLYSASWLSMNLILEKTTAPTASYSKNVNQVFTCHLELFYADLVNSVDCCDDSQKSCDLRLSLLESIKAAQIFGQYGNSTKAQKSLDYGTSLCDGTCGCN